MARRWAENGLDPESEVQKFLDLAFSMCPYSPYDAARFVDEVGRPPTQVVQQVWDRVRWPRSSGAAAAKANLLAAVVWDLRQWAGQVREEPLVIAVQVRRGSILCLGARPEPIARYLSQKPSTYEP
jgi:hypothetical protein